MTNELEKKLSDIDKQILENRETISLKETKVLFLKAKEFVDNAEEEEWTDEVKERVTKIFFKVVAISGIFNEKWQKKTFSPDDEELDFLEEVAEQFLMSFDNFSKKYPTIVDDNSRQDMENQKQAVQQEKYRRQQSPNKPSNFSPVLNASNNQQINQLQNQLNQLSQQIQTLLKNQKQNPTDNSNNNQFQQVQEQLNNLQNQIQNLEKQDNSSPQQTYKQELTKLRSQIQQLQESLQSKQSGKQKQKENSQQPKFNWLYVVIPGGILLVVSGIIIAYLLGKKK